jgi:alpha-methylacyl-CoA racemase
MNLVSAKPLAGIRVLDFTALGPGPFASRLLADYGAEVVMVEQPEVPVYDTNRGHFGRGKKSIVLDLKAPGATQFVLGIADKFDVLLESMRPGKMESLGLGPREVAECAPRLIYTRLTAFGQTGPLSQKAGHDINAIAIGGSLSLCGIGQPLPPHALLGDFAGGSMMIVIGVLLALRERQQSGRGRVVDASMTDGATQLSGAMMSGVKSSQMGPQGTNLIDGSRPFYTTYRCADGKWMAVGAIEPKFFREVIRGLNLEGVVEPRDQMNPAKATFIHKQFADKFLTKTRDDWERAFADFDACVSPVLGLGELPLHPHHQSRGSAFATSDGSVEPGIVPRLEGVDHTPSGPSLARGADTRSVMSACGVSEQALQAAIATGIVRL